MKDSKNERVDALLLTAKQAAAVCGMSLRTWRRKDAAGQVPAAVLVGGGPTKRLRAEELRRWSEAGCPPRSQWEEIRQSEAPSPRKRR
jgi:hypothetical protein